MRSLLALAAIVAGGAVVVGNQQQAPTEPAAMVGPNLPPTETEMMSRLDRVVSLLEKTMDQPDRPGLPPEPEVDPLADVVADMVAALKEEPKTSTVVASATRTITSPVVATGGGSTGNIVSYVSGPNLPPSTGGGSTGSFIVGSTYAYQPAWGTTSRVEVQRPAPVATVRANSLIRRARRCGLRGCRL